MTRLLPLVVCIAAAGCSGDVFAIELELGYDEESCGFVPPHEVLFDNEGMVVMHVFDVEEDELLAERCYHFPGEPGRDLFGLPEVLNVDEAHVDDLPAGSLIVVALKVYNRPDGACAPFEPDNPFNPPDLAGFSEEIRLEGEGGLIPLVLFCP